jgi:hypothetical protein
MKDVRGKDVLGNSGGDDIAVQDDDAVVRRHIIDQDQWTQMFE